MSEPRSNWADATMHREERAQLVARVLEVQRAYYDLWGRWPSAAEVLREIEGE